MSNLRSQIIRIASGLPPKDETRRKLLGLLREASLNPVGKTILDQMGGYGRLKMMIGLNQIINLPQGVGFKWPNKQISKGNYVEIILTPADLYNMTFYNVSMRGKRKVKEYRGIYNDMLVDLFEKQTGWYLRMGSLRMAKTKKVALGDRVDLQGIIDGYQKGKLKMFGPLVSLKDWVAAMVAGEVEEYNEFNVHRAARWLASQGIRKVHPAREYSVAVYFPLPPGANLSKFLRGSPAAADEVSLQFSPDGKTIAGNWYSKPPYYEAQQAQEEGADLWVRMWWD